MVALKDNHQLTVEARRALLIEAARAALGWREGIGIDGGGCRAPGSRHTAPYAGGTYPYYIDHSRDGLLVFRAHRSPAIVWNPFTDAAADYEIKEAAFARWGDRRRRAFDEQLARHMARHTNPAGLAIPALYQPGDYCVAAVAAVKLGRAQLYSMAALVASPGRRSPGALVRPTARGGAST
jgi:hypothetical protein